jgi:hypothetical protein
MKKITKSLHDDDDDGMEMEDNVKRKYEKFEQKYKIEK